MRGRCPNPILAPANLNQSSFGLVVSRKIKLIYLGADCPILDCHESFLFVKFTICHAVAMPKKSVSWTNGHFGRLCSAVPQKVNFTVCGLASFGLSGNVGNLSQVYEYPIKIEAVLFYPGFPTFWEKGFCSILSTSILHQGKNHFQRLGKYRIFLKFFLPIIHKLHHQ